MSERLDRFDPYHKWLGIPPAEQPPNLYRLLGVAAFEDDADVVASSADRQIAHIRTFQAGQHSADSQKLLNELAAARVCLLRPAEKAAYDSQLRRQVQLPQSAPSQPAPPQRLPVQTIPTPPRPLAAAPSVRWAHPLIAPMAAVAAPSVAVPVRDRLASVVEPGFVVDRKRTSGGSRAYRPRVSRWSLAMETPAAAPPPRDDLHVAGGDDASRRDELKPDQRSFSALRGVPASSCRWRPRGGIDFNEWIRQT